MVSDRPVFYVTLFEIFIRNGTATCNCFIDVLYKMPIQDINQTTLRDNV